KATTADGSNTSNPDEIVLSCLDILTDLLGRFGATAVSVTRQHEPILQICLTLLTGSSAVVRKRAGNTVGCLSVVLSDALLVSMVERLLSQIESLTDNNAQGDTRALIRTMCTVSGAVGHRLQQPQIDRIIPIFLRFTNPEDAITGDDDDDDDIEEKSSDDAAMDEDNMSQDEAAMAMANELRESCFMGFESFVLKCPTQVEPHLEKIIQAALAYMSYDPNYSYGTTNDEDDANGGGGDEDMDYEDDEYDEYEEEEEDDMDDDDDDESWKVRRSAIRALTAVVETKKHDPSNLWTHSYKVRRGKEDIVAAALVQRFKEREENCRVGVLDAFTKLLAVTIKAADTGTVIQFAAADGSADTSMDGITTIDLRTKYAPNLVKACEKLLSVKKGGERSKSHALALLSTLCKAPGGVGGQAEIMSVFEHVQAFLGDGSSDGDYHKEATSKALRLDALSLVVAMLDSGNHDPVHIRKGLSTALLPKLCVAVKEQWYKVIAEALRALAAVPPFFVNGYVEGGESSEEKKKEMDDVAAQLYASVEPLLAAHDVDQEIKGCALKATASLLSNLHGSLKPDQRSRLLSLLLERLRNDTTRIVAIKTLNAIAAASGDVDTAEKIDLSEILGDTIDSMAGFLKLQSRSLKQSSLEAFDIVITNHGSSLPADDAEKRYSMVISELADLVSDSDLHISHLSLRAAISALKICPACSSTIKDDILPTVLALSSSPLLQDLALESLLALLEQVVISEAVGFDELLEMFRGRLDQASSNKHSIYNLAQSIAVIAATTTPENLEGIIKETLATLEGSPTPEDPTKLKKVQLALLVSGDIGRRVDLGTMPGVAEKLNTIYMGYFSSSSEDLKNAAAYALGRAAVGSQSTFLPVIVEALEQNSEKKQYLLLSALRGFIQCSYQQSGGEGIAASLPVIMPHLETHASDGEEGVRTMVAECMGNLTCMQPAIMLEKLSKLVDAHSDIKAEGGMVDLADETSKKNALVCWTVATSLKLAIAGKTDQVQMSTYMPIFLKMLQVEELGVKNAALLMVYSAVHHMPQLVAGLMDQITPSLFEVATLTLERKVDLGPFTHKVDDALPLRKAALSIFATCLENLPASLDVAAFMPVLAKALSDKVEDIQLQAHQIIIG
ncbi:MAG: hypothetical protein SGILL_007996, partial [Bacillariaceae sp.]